MFYKNTKFSLFDQNANLFTYFKLKLEFLIMNNKNLTVDLIIPGNPH